MYQHAARLPASSFFSEVRVQGRKVRGREVRVQGREVRVQGREGGRVPNINEICGDLCQVEHHAAGAEVLVVVWSFSFRIRLSFLRLLLGVCCWGPGL